MVWYTRFVSLLVAATLSAGTARAGTILIDLDTSLAGIQDSRTINVGDMFEAAFVFEFGTSETIEGVTFDLNFNDAPGVLSITSLLAGGVVSGGGWEDFFNLGSALTVGDILTQSGFAFPDAPFFNNAIDGGIQNLSGLTEPLGTQVQLATFKVMGSSTGFSKLTFDQNTTGGTLADFDGFGTAIVTVNNNGVVPEPTSLVVWAVGSAVAFGFRRRRR